MLESYFLHPLERKFFQKKQCTKNSHGSFTNVFHIFLAGGNLKMGTYRMGKLMSFKDTVYLFLNLTWCWLTFGLLFYLLGLQEKAKGNAVMLWWFLRTQALGTESCVWLVALPITTALVFNSAALTNDYKCSALKRHKSVISQFCRSEVWHQSHCF